MKRAALWIALLVVLASCNSLPVPQSPAARAFVAAEVAPLPAAGDYSYTVADFAVAEETRRDIRDEGLRFLAVTGDGGFETGRRITGGDAPPEGRFLGSTEHLRLNGTGSVTLSAPGTILGMHVALPHESVLDLRWMEAGTQACVSISGRDRNGEPTRTIKTAAAYSTGEVTWVTDTWMWVDLTGLGEVTQVEMTFDAPTDDTPVLLVDNVTWSRNFQPDNDYFSIALLPDTAGYVVGDPGVLSAQVSFLRERARDESAPPLVYVSHTGGMVEDVTSEDQWRILDYSLGALDGVVPFGITIGDGDLEDPEDPALGTPLYLEFFPQDRFVSGGDDAGFSDDELSFYKVISTPAGDLLALHLLVDAPDPTLEWAQGVLDAHRSLPTMVTMHSYLELVNGEPRRLVEPLLAGPEETWLSYSAEEIWRTLVWPNDQIFLVVCGDGSGESLSIARNRSEDPVIEMLVSYSGRHAGPEGYLRLLNFYPERNELRAVTYSPWLDTLEQRQASSFVVPLDVSGRVGLE